MEKEDILFLKFKLQVIANCIEAINKTLTKHNSRTIQSALIKKAYSDYMKGLSIKDILEELMKKAD